MDAVFEKVGRVIAMGLVAVVASCDDGSENDNGGNGGNGPPPEIALADAPTELVNTLCATLADCVSVEMLETILGGDCASFAEPVLENAFFEGVEDAISGGAIVYHPDQMPACLSAIADLGCEGLSIDPEGPLNHRLGVGF